MKKIACIQMDTFCQSGLNRPWRVHPAFFAGGRRNKPFGVIYR